MSWLFGALKRYHDQISRLEVLVGVLIEGKGLYFNIVQFFFFNDTTTTEIYTLSQHDALPIC